MIDYVDSGQCEKKKEPSLRQSWYQTPPTPTFNVGKGGATRTRGWFFFFRTPGTLLPPHTNIDRGGMRGNHTDAIMVLFFALTGPTIRP